MKELLKEFKQLSKKEKIGHFGVWLAILAFLIFLYFSSKNLYIKIILLRIENELTLIEMS